MRGEGGLIANGSLVLALADGLIVRHTDGSTTNVGQGLTVPLADAQTADLPRLWRAAEGGP
jgi:hypothetical protein